MAARIWMFLALTATACAGGTLGRASFVEQADALCREAQRQLRAEVDRLGREFAASPSPSPSALAGEQALIQVAVTVNRSAEAGIRALRVADELVAVRDRLAAQLAVANTASSLALEAARRGDEKELKAQSARAAVGNDAFKRQAALLGMKSCAGED